MRRCRVCNTLVDELRPHIMTHYGIREGYKTGEGRMKARKTIFEEMKELRRAGIPPYPERAGTW